MLSKSPRPNPYPRSSFHDLEDIRELNLSDAAVAVDGAVGGVKGLGSTERLSTVQDSVVAFPHQSTDGPEFIYSIRPAKKPLDEMSA